MYTKFSRDSLKCVSCGLHQCQYCHHPSYILAEVIHKPIWKCINNGENGMYQLVTSKKQKSQRWGIYFSYVKHQQSTNPHLCSVLHTVLQRIVCIPLANCLYFSMYTSSKCFLKAFEN